VGAFGKNDQIGDRVIRMKVGTANRGAWSAEVVWMDSRWGEADGIILAPGKSQGATVGTPGLTTYDAEAENFPVTGDLTFIGGTVTDVNPEIVFRIGLKSAYKPTLDFPARYAVVVVTYGTKKQKIFLRQGEYDDYVMTPADLFLGVRRTYARKFSPYNLTAAMQDVVDITGTYPANNPGIFTDFPTKAGSHFQWADTATDTTHQRWAWPAQGATVTGMSISVTSALYWNTLGATHETCPAGYHRPNDGSIIGFEGGVTNSEMRQSLWSQPKAGAFYSDYTNNFWGYYADGFFDRRPIGMSNTDQPDSAVEAKSDDVAYNGCLFFNPTATSDHYNASLFFPACGWRSEAGVLTGTGRSCHYWSTSVLSTVVGWVMWVRFDRSATTAYENRAHGRSVRCVRNTT
jgi:hypothetical protein